jgi:hypothetical protein
MLWSKKTFGRALGTRSYYSNVGISVNSDHHTDIPSFVGLVVLQYVKCIHLTGLEIRWNHSELHVNESYRNVKHFHLPKDV